MVITKAELMGVESRRGWRWSNAGEPGMGKVGVVEEDGEEEY